MPRMAYHVTSIYSASYLPERNDEEEVPKSDHVKTPCGLRISREIRLLTSYIIVSVQ